MKNKIENDKPDNSSTDDCESVDLRLESGYCCSHLVHHPDLICQWLPDTTLTFVNKAYCRYFGKSSQELIGHSFLQLVPPEDHADILVHIKKMRQESAPYFIYEHQVINAKGERRWQQWVDYFHFDEMTQEEKVLSIGRDITKLKHSEHALIKKSAFTRLVAELSVNFINIHPDKFDDHINHLLKEIGQFSAVDRSYIFIFNHQKQMFTNTHEWCQEDITPQIQNLQSVPAEEIPWWTEKMMRLETVHIPEVEGLPPEASLEQSIFRAEDIQSLIAVPLNKTNHLLGFIGLDSVIKQKTWSDDDLTLLRMIGGIISNAIIEREAQSAADKRSDYLEKLKELTLTAINAECVDELLEAVVEQVGRFIGADGCFITLWDQKNERPIPAATSVPLENDYRNMVVKPDDVTMTASVLKMGHAIIVEDAYHSPHVSRQVAELFPTRSLLAVPMIVDEHKLGALLLAYQDPHHFNGEEVALAQQVGSLVGQALFKLDLLEKAQQSAQEAETLRKAGSIIASTLNPKIAIERILDQLERIVPFDSASIQILVDDHLEIMAGKGWSNAESPVGFRFPIPGDTPNTRVIEGRVPIVLDDAPTAYSIFTEEPHSHIRSWMGVPLIVHDRVIGMLTLDHEQPNFYDDQLVTLAESFANQVAISLENARLFDNERHRVQELDALRTTITDITGELALPSLSRAIIERATALLGAAGGELGLYDPDNEKITILVSYQMGMDNAGIIIDMGEGLMGHVAETQKNLRIDDYQVWAGQSEKYQACIIHGAIAAPLMIRRRFLGVLGIMTTDPKHKFTTSDLNLLSLFAQQAAIAVENAQLFEEKERQVRTDALTGVYNRWGLSEFGQRELDRAYRYDRPLAAIMLDIDNFKKINDTHGHAIGDLILIELAGRLTNNLRDIDILVRYGGEEFAILLPETNLENASLLAERLRDSVANLPFRVNSLTLEVTISLGVAGKSEKKQVLNDLISQADQAMYQAKDSGRNCVSVG